MATHHSHYDPENSTTHYTVLPDQPESAGSGHRKSLKVVSGILLSSFFLLSLVFVIVNQSSDLSQKNSHSSETLTPALSRGVSQGVSEKTFKDVSGRSLSYYPWTNAMLTWQRTAYHFQPQKNWMNGNLFLASFSLINSFNKIWILDTYTGFFLLILMAILLGYPMDSDWMICCRS